MTYVITGCLTVITGVLVFIITNLLKDNKELRKAQKIKDDTKNNAIIEGIVCILRVKLIEYHDRYVDLGSIPAYAFENWTKMYHAYTTLGGNGMIVGMNEEVERLPIR